MLERTKKPYTCASCGFLALLQNVEQRFVEADQHFRQHGALAPAKMGHAILGHPRCALLQADLYVEAGERPWPNPSVVQNVIYKDRPECRSDEPEHWIQWIPGLSPERHREMLDREFMLRREDARDEVMRRREDERDAAQKRWQDAAEEASERRHLAQLTVAKETSKAEIKTLGWWAIGILSVVTVIASIIQANWWAPPWARNAVVIVATPTPLPPTATPPPTETPTPPAPATP